MSVFGNYSRYYDLLYKDKDYGGEADYIASQMANYHPGAKTLLELGCGSGRHAQLLAQKGYRVDGVDISHEMLTQATLRRDQSDAAVRERLEFSHGDVRQFRNGQTYDVVLSLFHVVSYHPTTEDLLNAFATARKHLNPGGIFMFDVWYAPAVVAQKPSVRVKNMEDAFVEVTRIAEPKVHPNECWVDVNYTVFIRDKQNGSMETLKESHRMHYLTHTEIELLCRHTNFSIEKAEEWLTGATPDASTWGICFVVRAI